MSKRLVFGVSLSPREILEVQHACDAAACLRVLRGEIKFDMPVICSTCRYQDPCSMRLDNPDAAETAAGAMEEAIRLECVSGDRKCARHPLCGHGPTQAELDDAFAEEG